MASIDISRSRKRPTEKSMKAQLFLIVYAHRRRIKVWGTARAVEGDEALLHRLIPEGYRARPKVVALDSFHLPLSTRPQKFTKLKGIPGAVRDASPDA